MPGDHHIHLSLTQIVEITIVILTFYLIDAKELKCIYINADIW